VPTKINKNPIRPYVQRNLLKLLTMKFFIFRNCKSKKDKFHKYENNLPHKKNSPFSNFELEILLLIKLFEISNLR